MSFKSGKFLLLIFYKLFFEDETNLTITAELSDSQQSPVSSAQNQNKPKVKSNFPQNQANLPQSIPKLPQNQPNLPKSIPNLPQNQPNLPKSIPNSSQSIPNLPQIIPNLPQKQPNSSKNISSPKNSKEPLCQSNIKASKVPINKSKSSDLLQEFLELTKLPVNTRFGPKPLLTPKKPPRLDR